jgi:membrane-bound serine protease (ClpP class)
VTGTLFLVLGLFLVGMMLIAVEALVIPGFGLAGIAGMLMVGFTIYHAWSELGAGWGVTLAVTALLGSVALVLWVPHSRLGKGLRLTTAMDGLAAYDHDAKRAGIGPGSRGQTVTQLRPSGFAMFGDSRVEVRSDGDYVASGVPVQVVALKDGKVFVEIAETAEPELIADESTHG